MAVFSSVFIPAEVTPTKIAALGASTASSEQVLGINTIFAINADQDITIRFGTAGMAAPDTTYFRIPANATFTFDMGPNNDRIRVFNQSASVVNVYIQPLSKF